MSGFFGKVQGKVYVLSNKTNTCNILFAHSARASFGFPYFDPSLKFLQGFKNFNMLRYYTMAQILGPRNLTDWILHGIYVFGVLLKYYINDLLPISVINVA